ncbi:MAG: ABC transporter ATP-binding protein [Lachnospiraceae bacterium]
MKELMRLNQICKVFDKGMDELVVLDGMDMAIQEKEFVCIMGPSGCGKSTLLKIIGGIEEPTLGTIEMGNEVFEKGVPKNRLKDFGFVFQQHNLLEWRTVRKNLSLNLDIFKLKGEEWDKRVEEMLEIVGLKEYSGIYPHELSGGMKQRTGIARALVHDPKVLLMDQPFGALDAITRNMLSFEMLGIWKKTQKTMVMVTNSVEEALLVSNRVLMMSKTGDIVYEVENDIPMDARNEQIAYNERYNVLRMKLNDIVHEIQD